ncbi:hypothetical protein [Burkholderia sp. F1]|uniref:hypothetical protein n=1 Tax=Burkholderia sp. F1 TaxID=3366817 RepID=UPI003D7561CF
MTRSIDIRQEGPAGHSGMTRCTFVKRAAVAAVAVPAVAAMRSAPPQTVASAKATADLEKYRALGGWVERPDDMQSLVGDVTGAHQNIYYSAGCTGHGVASQSMLGNMIAQRIRGSEPPLLAALDHKTPSQLPEPFRWCAFNGALTGVNALDDWVNRKARDASA